MKQERINEILNLIRNNLSVFKNVVNDYVEHAIEILEEIEAGNDGYDDITNDYNLMTSIQEVFNEEKINEILDDDDENLDGFDENLDDGIQDENIDSDIEDEFDRFVNMIERGEE